MLLGQSYAGGLIRIFIQNLTLLGRVICQPNALGIVMKEPKMGKIGMTVITGAIILSLVPLSAAVEETSIDNISVGQRDATYAGTGKLGVLITAHGTPGSWNRGLNDWAMQLKIMLPVPVAVGFLEYTPWQTIEGAVKNLESKGVTEIIAYQIMVSANSSHTPEIYEAIEGSTDKTPIYCVAHGFGDAPEMAESIIDRGLILCEDDYNDWFDKEVNPKEATLIFTMHGAPMGMGNVEAWEALGKSLKNQIENRGIFKEVRYCPGDLRGAVDSASGYPLIVPQFVVSGSFVDLQHKPKLIGKGYEYDGKCIIDTQGSYDWVMNRFNDYPDNIVWANHVVGEN